MFLQEDQIGISARICRRKTMMKDTRLTFRVRSLVKKELEAIAAREGRSVAQICEAFLAVGTKGYKKKGSQYFRRYFSRSKKEDLLK